MLCPRCNASRFFVYFQHVVVVCPWKGTSETYDETVEKVVCAVCGEELPPHMQRELFGEMEWEDYDNYFKPANNSTNSNKSSTNEEQKSTTNKRPKITKFEFDI